MSHALRLYLISTKKFPSSYQRLWGSVGWGTFAILSGWLIDKFSEGKTTKNYSVGFLMMAVLLLLDIIVSSRLKHTQTKLSSSIFKDVGKIFRSLRVIVFFLWCVTVGLGTAMIWNFLFWHLEVLAANQEECAYDSSMKTLQVFANFLENRLDLNA